jgi:predicted ATP-grasp superfamily ATP-dependent carboligase
VRQIILINGCQKRTGLNITRIRLFQDIDTVMLIVSIVCISISQWNSFNVCVVVYFKQLVTGVVSIGF